MQVFSVLELPREGEVGTLVGVLWEAVVSVFDCVDVKVSTLLCIMMESC